MLFGEKIIFEVVFERWQFSLLAALCIALALPAKLGSETATLTTYYAAPMSSYDSLRVSNYATIGTTYVSGKVSGTTTLTSSLRLGAGITSNTATAGLTLAGADSLTGSYLLTLDVSNTAANSSTAGKEIGDDADGKGRLFLAPNDGSVTFNSSIKNVCKWVPYKSNGGGTYPCGAGYMAFAAGYGTAPDIKVTFDPLITSGDAASMLCCRMTFF